MAGNSSAAGSDGAGIKAALRAIPILREAGLSIKVLSMKPYKDPDEFIKALGPEAYEERIEKATNYFIFQVGTLMNEYNLDDPSEKTEFHNKVADMLLEFEDEIERNNYLESVCRTFNIPLDGLRQLVKKKGLNYIGKKQREENLAYINNLFEKSLDNWYASFQLYAFSKLIEAIKSGKSQTIEPEYTYKGYVRDTNDIGNTYVEVSLSAQHMWFYKNGQLLVDTDVVTGNHNLGHDTKTGIYAIMYKERNATLVGEDYSSPVKYWMPFYANVGIHDASWRTTFGGSEYLNNGSHGCVNTPEANAEKIFNNIEKGVPVVVY